MDTAPDREAAADILLKYMILFFFFLSQIGLKTADRQWAVGSGQAAETCSVLLLLFIYTGVQERHRRPSGELLSLRGASESLG